MNKIEKKYLLENDIDTIKLRNCLPEELLKIYKKTNVFEKEYNDPDNFKQKLKSMFLKRWLKGYWLKSPFSALLVLSFIS